MAENIVLNFLKTNARKGGFALVKKYGRGYMARQGKRGAKKRWMKHKKGEVVDNLI